MILTLSITAAALLVYFHVPLRQVAIVTGVVCLQAVALGAGPADTHAARCPARRPEPPIAQQTPSGL
jgi:hypothetical protein